MEQGITWEDRVKGAYASLRPSEQKVAEFFLAHAEELEDLTIGELARGAGVSEPTVIRCVRGLGYRGYREFKGALSQKEGQVRGNALDYLGGFALRPWERMGDLPLKAVRTHRAQLEETLKSVPTGELERAARILAGAQFIDIYGVENSCAPASDLLTKLTYLGLPCRFHTDAYLQQIGAAHLRPGAAAIAFSMEDAQRMCDFCQAYYGTGAGGFEEPLALAPAGYLLPFVNAQGERITLSLSTDVHQDPNMSQDHFVLAFNDLPSYDVSS